MSRAKVYSAEIADQICEAVACGKSLAKTCEPKNMPSLRTVFYWLRDEAHREFQSAFELAKQERAHFLAEECLEIADAKVGSVDTQHGTHMDAAEVNNKRLRVDTRKWFTSHLFPRVYGDKVTTELSGPGGGAIPIATGPQVPDYDKHIAAFKAKYGDLEVGGVSK